MCLWPSNHYTVKEVLSGNSLLLNNGTTVNLIGITNTQEGLQEMKNMALGQEVELIPDKSNMFDQDNIPDNSMVYAYVRLPKQAYKCINATLLKGGKAMIQEETFLVDSLASFRSYSCSGGETNPTPTPIPPKPTKHEDLVLPDYTPAPERRYSCWYSNTQENIAMLTDACDFNHTYTKGFANQLAGKSPGNFNIGQVCEIFDYCYTNWKYVNDPDGQEYLATASESIYNGLVGDCDDFAIMMAACVIAIGGEATIITAWGSQGGHAYCEVNISKWNENEIDRNISERFPNKHGKIVTTRHDEKTWLNLDWQSAYPGGSEFSHNEHKRYVYSASDNAWHCSQN